MIDFFNKIYSSIITKNESLDRIRFYSLLRFITRVSANILLPFYFKLTCNNKNYRIISEEKKDCPRIIVSLTSFPTRIHKTWLAIETILRQTYKPDMIILWLSEDQFPSLNSVPSNLLKLQKRGLTINIQPNDLRSHKKYYYALKEYPNDTIITVDDDIFYYSKMIEILINHSKGYPNCTIANFCRKATFDKDGVLNPYTTWPVQEKTEHSKYTSGIGSGGILYPPNVLHPDVDNTTVFSEICFFADDIWLYFMTLLAGNCCIKSQTPIIYNLPILIKNDIRLTRLNDDLGKNDEQINAVLNYFDVKYNKNPLK